MSSPFYLEPSGAELSALVRRHFGAAGFTFTPKAGGMFNTTGLLELSDGRRCILRCAPVQHGLLLPFEANLMQSEAVFYRLCGEAGVPVPRVYACVTDKKLLPRDYMLTEYVESVPLSAKEITPEERSLLHAEAGELSARWNVVRGGCFGRLADAAAGRGFDRWADFLSAELEAVSRFLAPYGVFSASELCELRALPERFSALLDAVTEPELVHADLWEGNLLVTPDHRHIAAVIDGDRSLFGDFAAEFAGEWMTSPAFLAHRRPLGEAEPACALRQKLYVLWYRLIDAYVYLAEYRDPKACAWSARCVRRLYRALSAAFFS